MPFRLRKLKGGVDAHATVESILSSSAFEKIWTFPDFENVNNNDIPTYFKLGKIIKIEDEIHLAMSNELSFANCSDGVSVNLKAARVLTELLGFFCPDFRFSSHTADGCWKRIARSETMCVDEVKQLYDNLKPICEHFKLSNKSKDKLDAFMAAL